MIDYKLRTWFTRHDPPKPAFRVSVDIKKLDATQGNWDLVGSPDELRFGDRDIANKELTIIQNHEWKDEEIIVAGYTVIYMMFLINGLPYLEYHTNSAAQAIVVKQWFINESKK